MILYIEKDVANEITVEDEDGDEIDCAKKVLNDVHSDESTIAND